MSIRARVIPFVFDWERFSDDLRQATLEGGINRAILADLIGIDVSTLGNWINCRYPNNSYPLVKHFLAACNWLDVDPRQYFVLASE